MKSERLKKRQQDNLKNILLWQQLWTLKPILAGIRKHYAK